MSAIDALANYLHSSGQWPPKREESVYAQIAAGRSFYDADTCRLRRMQQPREDWDDKRRYVHDPIAASISSAYADFLFGEPPEIAAVTETDATDDRLHEIVETNRLDAKLRDAHEQYVSAEGEAWWRIRTERSAAGVPLIDFCSRSCVVPLISSGIVVAAAFWRQLDSDDKNVVYRHLELQSDGETINRLYRGKTDKLGDPIALAAHSETEDLDEEWTHGLPMLCGRVVNGAGLHDDIGVGVSDYYRIKSFLLALDEAATIGAENATLTLKKRLFMQGQILKENGDFDAGKDIIRVESSEETVGEQSSVPIQAVEYSFDAAELVTWREHLTKTILNRVGLVPQITGDNVEGQAESGTAIRLRFLPTTLAATGRSREWIAALPQILSLAMRLDSLPLDDGGFAQAKTYSDGYDVTVELSSILPRDEQEIVSANALAVTSQIRSRKIAIRDQHPEWTEEQIDEELQQILTETSTLLDGGVKPSDREFVASPAGAEVTLGTNNSANNGGQK